MNLVLFLGAGFSVAHGLPVMDGFIRHAQLSNRLTEAQKASLGQLVLKARAANAFLSSSPTNLEHLLSFAVMADRLGLPGGGQLCAEMTLILGQIYSEGLSLNDYGRQHDKFKKLILPKGANRVNLPDHWKTHELAVITTNYDINAEVAIRRLGFEIDLGFEPIPEDGTQNKFGLNLKMTSNLYSKSPNASSLKLYKLHGSVNWFPSNDPICPEEIRADGRMVRQQEVFGLAKNGMEPKEDMPLVNDDHYWKLAPNSPIIIPPSFLKPIFRGPLAEVWRGAAKALNRAHTVAFVGYSFPETDNEMLYLLATAFSDNQNLQAIKIVDPRAQEICDRLKSSSSRVGSHFQGLLRPERINSWVEIENIFDI